MNIKDKEGQVRISFSDFKKEYEGDPVFVNLLVTVSLDNASATEFISVELSNLKELNRCLKILNETLIQTFYFQHIDNQLEIKFEPQVTGNIVITGYLKDKTYTNTLGFSFELSPSELPQLIRECEDMVNALNK